MISESELFIFLNKFKNKYLKASVYYTKDESFLKKKDIEACDLIDEFLKYYGYKQNEFNYLKKYFLYRAMATLVNTKFYYLFYIFLVDVFISQEDEWAEEDIENFKNEPSANFTIQDFNVLLKNVRKFLS